MTFEVKDRVKDTARDREGEVFSKSASGMVLVVIWDGGEVGTIDAKDCTRAFKPVNVRGRR